MARETGESEGTIRKIIKDDLKANSRARTSQAQSKLKGFKDSKRLLNLLKNRKKPKILFSGQKIFNIDSVHNSRNNSYISPKKAEDVPKNIRDTFQMKHPAAAMVFGLITSDGKKCLQFFSLWLKNYS